MESAANCESVSKVDPEHVMVDGIQLPCMACDHFGAFRMFLF